MVHQAAYRTKAARAARPARPMGPAVTMAALPEEVEVEALLEEEPLEEDEDEDEPVWVDVLVSVVVEPVVLAEDVKPLLVAVALLLLLLPLLVAGVTTGEVKPAGIEAAGCCEVTAEGWVVTAAGWEVTASGWPVTTPRELVSVRYLVAGLPSLELELELEESAAMAPMARAEREATMMEARMLMVLIWVVRVTWRETM